MTVVVGTPMRVEQAAVRGDGLSPARTGMGARRAREYATAHAGWGGAMLVAGVAGALRPGLAPGDLVVASEVHAEDRVVPCPSAPLLLTALRELGITAYQGPIVTVPRLVPGVARARLGEAGALVADLESGYLADCAGPAFAVVRVVVDTIDYPLSTPGTLVRGVRALRTLRRARPALANWVAATGRREVIAGDLGGVDESDPLGEGSIGPEPGPDSGHGVLVVGTGHTPRSRALLDSAARAGAPVLMRASPAEAELGWLAGVRTLTVAVGTGCSPWALDELLEHLAGLGEVRLRAPAGPQLEQGPELEQGPQLEQGPELEREAG